MNADKTVAEEADRNRRSRLQADLSASASPLPAGERGFAEKFDQICDELPRFDPLWTCSFGQRHIGTMYLTNSLFLRRGA